MARHTNTFITFAIVVIFYLVSSLPSRVLVTAGHGDDHNETSQVSDTTAHHSVITIKYGFVWTKTAKPSPRYDFSNFTDDIDSVECTDDRPCVAALPGVEDAVSIDSDIASKPYCVYDSWSNSTTGHCSCGVGRCVSYSRHSVSGDPFYYCGKCGSIGSQCKQYCDTTVGECRGGYCECIKDGTFYDMSSCYIPFYGQGTLTNIIIGTICVLLCVVLLAYIYHKLRTRHRLRRGSLYSERGSGSTRRESPPDDTPPTYDDVVEKLPSYQDALEMSATHERDEGFTNLGFEEDEAASPPPTTHRGSAASDLVILSQTSATFQAKVPDQTNSSALCSGAEDVKDRGKNENENSSNTTQQITEEQRDLGAQPIEQLLHRTLQEQHSTIL